MSSLPRITVVGLAGLVCLTGCEPKQEGTPADAEVQGTIESQDTAEEVPATDEDADSDGVLADRDCDDGDPAVGGPKLWFSDVDGDGHAGDAVTEEACLAPLDFYAEPTDCDDADPSVHPSAAEVCNGIDDDCDADVDLDDDSLDLSTASDRFPDRDGDGYGDPAGRYTGCPTDPDTADNGDDCDDTDSSRSPETQWHADTDSDGYGTPDNTRTQCEAPSGWTRASGDCDDTDAAVRPGAVEVCDAVDNDCDGDVDDADAGLDTTTATDFFSDTDGDGFGDDSAAERTCAPRSGRIDVGGDCDDTDPAIHPDADDACGDGIDSDCDGVVPAVCGGGTLTASELDAVLVGEASGDEAGRSVAFAGDVDGDGLGEVLVGAPNNDDSGVGAGKVYLVPGIVAAGGSGLGTVPGWAGEAAGDSMGEKVAAAGDVDGDGYDDLLFGAKDSDAERTNAGRAYLVFGSASLGAISSFATGAVTWDGLGVGDALGHGIAPAGDHNGDGYADLLLGAPDVDDSGSNAGAVYLVYGSATLTSGTVANQPAFTGASAGDALGHWFGLGHVDFDGDGTDDLALGAYKADDTDADVGAVYLFEGGSRWSGSTSVDDATATLTGTSFGGGNSYFGYAVADAPGDVNGDGHDDLVIGAYYWDEGAENAGGLFVFFGDVSALDADQTAADADARLVGATAYDYCGKDVAVLPDIDGDGTDDLVLGCYGEDSAGYTAGAAYFVRGDAVSGALWMPSDATFTIEGDRSGDSLGHSMAGGDLDGDGLGDLFVGASDAGTSSEGSLLLFFGATGLGTGG